MRLFTSRAALLNTVPGTRHHSPTFPLSTKSGSSSIGHPPLRWSITSFVSSQWTRRQPFSSISKATWPRTLVELPFLDHGYVSPSAFDVGGHHVVQPLFRRLRVRVPGQLSPAEAPQPPKGVQVQEKPTGRPSASIPPGDHPFHQGSHRPWGPGSCFLRGRLRGSHNLGAPCAVPSRHPR